MSRKKHPEHVNHERWLVSYADFITLLFAFFVVLFASSKSDKKKQIQLSAVIQSAFAQMGIFDAHSPIPPLTDSHTASADSVPAALALPLPPSAGTLPTLDELRRQLQASIAREVAAGHIPPGSVTFRSSPDGLVISLHEAGFFPSGSSEVQPSALSTVIALARQLPQAPLRIEGHTDNRPIHNPRFASNWELSSARASAIARLLLSYGSFHPVDLSVAGYAEFHPLASNATEAGRTQNRRVDIVELGPPPTSPTPSRPAPSR